MEGAAYYFEVSVPNWFFYSIKLVRNGTCELKLYDNTESAMTSNEPASSITATGNDYDIGWLRFVNQQDSGGSSITGYLDAMKCTTSGWVTPADIP